MNLKINCNHFILYFSNTFVLQNNLGIIRGVHFFLPTTEYIQPKDKLLAKLLQINTCKKFF